MARWKKELYEGWGKSSTQVEEETQKITIKGLRLTRDEKDTCFYFLHQYPEEYSLTDGTLKELILEMREDAVKWEKNEGKQIREFVKEIRRLERKYDCFQEEDKTLDELVDMWMHNYFCIYFLDDHLDCIMMNGGKKYAQYYLHIRGVIPEKEVTIWQKDMN